MNKWMKLVCFLAICLLMIGCGSSHSEQANKELETGFIPARAGMYDSADTAMIKRINKQDQTITFYNLFRAKNYTLNYDGTTALYDKYGSALTLEQVDEGDIVEITFLKEKKALASLQKSDESFLLEDVTNFSIDERAKEMKIGDSTYRFEEDLFIFSDGEQVEIMDINQVDTLRVQGIDHTVYSVYIDKGHGYLRLKNDEYFRGGWIEVGKSIIMPIEEDMLLIVPEGKYDVLLSTKGISTSKRVTIKRDKETELDVGDLKKEEDQKKYGNLIFVVSPEDASVYIDGQAVDISLPVQAEYGIHQLMAKADGYQTVMQYIKVAEENATLQIELEEDDGTSASSNSVSDNDVTTTSGGKITIDAPVRVEVYVDGSYVGIAPCSFQKTVGVHVITLRQEGYETRSYTINVTNVSTNENMSFSALVKEETKVEDEKKEEDKKESEVKKEEEKEDISEAETTETETETETEIETETQISEVPSEEEEISTEEDSSIEEQKD